MYGPTIAHKPTFCWGFIDRYLSPSIKLSILPACTATLSTRRQLISLLRFSDISSSFSPRSSFSASSTASCSFPSSSPSSGLPPRSSRRTAATPSLHQLQRAPPALENAASCHRDEEGLRAPQTEEFASAATPPPLPPPPLQLHQFPYSRDRGRRLAATTLTSV